MKISIKLDKRKSSQNQQGFPVVVRVYISGKTKMVATGFYSSIDHWNDEFSLPTKRHPDYYLFRDYLDNLQDRIKAVRIRALRSSLSVNDVASFLFEKSHTSFYEAALATRPDPDDYNDPRICALKDFNTMFPSVAVDSISWEMVDRYLKDRLKKRKARGVNSYLGSLKTIFGKVSTAENPFKGHRIVLPNKINKVANSDDLKILKDADLPFTQFVGGKAHYRNYWLLMFYLGGIDPEVLVRLRYDENVVGNRIMYSRNKGGSQMDCNNYIFPQAWEILKLYDCKPYLVPIYKTSYPSFRRNFNRRFKELCTELGLSVALRTKGPRYTFIDRAQQLLVDERITGQIVGHKRQTTTSLYTNEFPLVVQDEAHKKIIQL